MNSSFACCIISLAIVVYLLELDIRPFKKEMKIKQCTSYMLPWFIEVCYLLVGTIAASYPLFQSDNMAVVT